MPQKYEFRLRLRRAKEAFNVPGRDDRWPWDRCDET